MIRGLVPVVVLALAAPTAALPAHARERIAGDPSARVMIDTSKPLDFTGRFEGVPLGRARREATDEIMAAIQGITGQEEAGVYNERPPA